MRVDTESGPSGKKYLAVGNDGMTLAKFDTHAEAWRFIDKQMGENLNPQEKKSAWIVEQILGGTGRKM